MEQLPVSYLLTSESVTEGHPDKVCDRIADTVLDTILTREAELAAQGYVDSNGQPADPALARSACEVLATKGLVVLAGEISTQAYVDFELVARQVISDIGYIYPELGFDAASCGILNSIHSQSADIAQAVDKKPQDGLLTRTEDPLERLGAGDQGLIYGYATDETDVLMPLPIFLAHRLAERLAAVRKQGTLPYLRPDGKTQVAVRYVHGRPQRVEKILISAQHTADVSLEEQLRPDLQRYVIAPVMEQWQVDWQDAAVLINPSNRFVIGGPAGDTGLTGRKIIVDSYGGCSRHGGGSFSGKDPTKVDRSAAYALRWVAKNLVAAGLARRCEVQAAYAIGQVEPFSLMVDSFGTGQVADSLLTEAVRQVFDLRPAAIIQSLDLIRPIYALTSNYGHFGRELPEFTWERTDRTEELRATVAQLSAALAG